MRVKVMSHLYRMSRQEYQGLLKIAAKQVPLGVYALEKGDYAELRCDHCCSMGELKRLSRRFRAQGFKVYSNGK